MEQDGIARKIAAAGFVHLGAARMRELLEAAGGLADMVAFAASWDDLGPDTYMADGGRYRKRRHATFVAVAGEPGIRRQPHQPHYQSRDYNALNGGIERWFGPVDEGVAAGAAMRAVLGFCRGVFDRLIPAATWHIELHQFRIEARPGELGRPTPEGMHRDGVEYVLVMLVRRQNIKEGVTTISDEGGGQLASFTLVEPLEAVLLDDHRIYHGVTPVEPVDPAAPAFRDVLVMTFRQA